MMLAVTLMFAGQTVVPSDVINAQDEAKPRGQS